MKFSKKLGVIASVTGLVVSSSLLSPLASAQSIYTEVTVEELRIDKAQRQFPDVAGRLDNRVNVFSQQISQARNFTALTQLILRHGKALWQEAVESFEQRQDYDDRPLYWARLKMFAALRQAEAFINLHDSQQQQLLWQFEQLTRGLDDVNFNRHTAKKILITGFDPFFLDKNLGQSNPSGVAALALDDRVLSIDGQSVEIESLMIPVRFADFDQGLIEDMLTDIMKKQGIDMLVTISMGREHFDLERFPGLRRSAKAPDNLNVYTGADKESPVVPELRGQPLSGPEFVEFSLPVNLMLRAVGDYQINDNRKVTTLTGEKRPSRLKELSGETSVEGSGGGYLSNEISYRTILLRDQYAPILPVGHIHTPRVKGFSPGSNEKIVRQIRSMLSMATRGI